MLNLKLLFALLLALAWQGALAQVMYRMQPLETLDGCSPNVTAFNNADQATGEICAGDSVHAFLWKHDGTPPLDLGPEQAGSISIGTAINESGIVTGYAYGTDQGTFSFVSSGDGTPIQRIYDSLGGTQIAALDINGLGQLTGNASTDRDATTYHAFVWKNDGSPVRDLGSLGGDLSTGTAINDVGQVAGYSDLPGNAAHHAFIWRNNGTPLHDLGTLGGASSQALFINASGQVAGNSVMPGPNRNEHAFFWPNNGMPMKDLGTLGGLTSVAAALNDAGQIAGSSTTGPGRTTHAFVWLNDGTRMKDLAGTDSAAADINASGQVTGWTIVSNARHAFLWRNDGTPIQDLNKLIDPRDPLKRYVTLTRGNFINDSGDIMAQGDDVRTGTGRAYLLHGTVIKLMPRSLAFGDQRANTSSAAKPVTVTNTSSKVVPFSGTALTGAAAGQYVVNGNCGASLAAHASCTIQVSFRPTTPGAKYGFLKVNGGEGGLLLVHLAGTGT